MQAGLAGAVVRYGFAVPARKPAMKPVKCCKNATTLSRLKDYAILMLVRCSIVVHSLKGRWECFPKRGATSWRRRDEAPIHVRKIAMRTSIRGLLAATTVSAGLLFAAPAFADDTAPPSDFTITGSAAIVSQYRFRGISQSDNKPAVQGAITLSHSSGFYVSTWGSSASAGNSTVNIGGTEIDVYGGYAKEFAGVKVDVGVYGYLYPGASGLNYYEVYGNLSKSFGPVGAKVGVYFAPNQKNTVKDNTYVFGELGTAIPGTPLSLHSHLGYTSGAFDYTKAYLDYSVGASASWKNLSLDLSWVDTNVSKSDATLSPFADQTGTPSPFETYRAAKGVAVLSLTAAF
jgi:uncharacterized protein (TIGR02001 family)